MSKLIVNRFPISIYEAMLNCFTPLEALDIDQHFGGTCVVKLKRNIEKFDQSLWCVTASMKHLGAMTCLHKMTCTIMDKLVQSCVDAGFEEGLAFLLWKDFYTDGRHKINVRDCTRQIDVACMRNFLRIIDIVLNIFNPRCQYLAQPGATLAKIIED